MSSNTESKPKRDFKRVTSNTITRFTHERTRLLDQIAESRNMKRCQVVREAVEFYLAQKYPQQS